MTDTKPVEQQIAPDDEPIFHLRSYGDVTLAQLEELTRQKPPDAPPVLPMLPAGMLSASACYTADQMRECARSALTTRAEPSTLRAVGWLAARAALNLPTPFRSRGAQSSPDGTLTCDVWCREQMKEAMRWHQAVLEQCMFTEACYVESDPSASVGNLIDWHIRNRQWFCLANTPDRAQQVQPPAEPVLGEAVEACLRTRHPCNVDSPPDSQAAVADALEQHNAWRRGDHEPCDAPVTGEALGVVIDRAVALLRATMTHQINNEQQWMAILNACWMAIPERFRDPSANDETGNPLPSAVRALVAALASTAEQSIHYPDCWDTAAYPTAADALSAVYAHYRCTNADTHADAPEFVRVEPLYGWRIVPIEPTQAMLDANGRSIAPEGQAWLHRDARETWAAMLAAAPVPHHTEEAHMTKIDELQWVNVEHCVDGVMYVLDPSGSLMFRDDVLAAISKAVSAERTRLSAPLNGLEPDTHCEDLDTGKQVWSYSEELVRQIVAAERETWSAMLAAAALTRMLDRCKCGVFVEVNEHRDYYDSVQTKIDEIHMNDGDSLEPEIVAGMLATGNIVHLQAYPETPVGFVQVWHFDMDAALDELWLGICEKYGAERADGDRP